MRFPLLLLAALVLIMQPLPSAAAGYPSIDGIASDGHTIAIDFDVSPPRVEMWIETNDKALRQRSVRTFVDEPCTFKEHVSQRGRVVRLFACATSAKSPLAGTKYRGTQVDGDCEGGDPDFRYVCVSGCNQNKRAPRRMSQQHWEC